MPQLILTHGIRVINFIAENQEGYFGQVLHRQKRVELGFGFGEAFVVFGVDKEYDTGNFGEVVFPEAAG